MGMMRLCGIAQVLLRVQKLNLLMKEDGSRVTIPRHRSQVPIPFSPYGHTLSPTPSLRKPVPPHPAELAAEKEVLRRQAAVKAAPADDLRRLQERLAS